MIITCQIVNTPQSIMLNPRDKENESAELQDCTQN